MSCAVVTAVVDRRRSLGWASTARCQQSLRMEPPRLRLWALASILVLERLEPIRNIQPRHMPARPHRTPHNRFATGHGVGIRASELGDDLILTRSLNVPRYSGQAIKPRDAGVARALQICGSELRKAGRRRMRVVPSCLPRSEARAFVHMLWCSCDPKIHRSPLIPTCRRPSE